MAINIRDNRSGAARPFVTPVDIAPNISERNKLDVSVYSAENYPKSPVISEFIRRLINTPNPGSEFEQKTRDVRPLPQDKQVAAVFERGYGIVVASRGINVAGFIAFQRRDDELHAFRIQTFDKSLSSITSLVDGFLDYARGHDISRARISAGGSEKISDLLDFARRNSAIRGRFRVRVLDDGWIEIQK